MILDLVKYTDPILHQPAEKFDFAKPPFDPIEFANNLVETMLAHRGFGLSAPQVGVPFKVLSIASNPCGVFYNPKIVTLSEATTDLEEGCLSYPGLLLNVARSRIVRVRYTLPNGETLTKQFSDFTARVIQHECDHLDGVTIIDRQVGLKKEFAKKKWKKMLAQGGGKLAPIETGLSYSRVIGGAEMQFNVQNKVKEDRDTRLG